MAQDETGPPRPGDPTGAHGGNPEVGSVGEEAAKLFGALSDWAKDQQSDYSATAGEAAAGLAGAMHQVNDHLATGSEDCRYCPVCQVIHAVRATSPEVRDHLSSAAMSLLQAASSLLATSPPGESSSAGQPGVQKIDLDDGDEFGDEFGDEPDKDRGDDRP